METKMDIELRKKLTDMWVQSLRLPKKIEIIKEELSDLIKISDNIEKTLDELNKEYEEGKLE